MGWTNDAHPGHEGYLVAFVTDGEGRLRRLGYPRNDQSIDRVHAIAVACECGWQSPRYHAPYGTKWHPFSVVLPERDSSFLEACANGLWHRHLESDALWTIQAYGTGDPPIAQLELCTPITAIDAAHRDELVARSRVKRRAGP